MPQIFTIPGQEQSKFELKSKAQEWPIQKATNLRQITNGNYYRFPPNFEGPGRVQQW